MQRLVSISSKGMSFKGQKSSYGFLKAVRDQSHSIAAIENIIVCLVVWTGVGHIAQNRIK